MYLELQLTKVEWLVSLLGLLVLALIALGVKVALHVVQPHPHSSPVTHKSRAAILVLVVSSAAVLLLSLLWIVSGRIYPDYFMAEFLLVRTMTLICLLLFTEACIAYFRRDRCRRSRIEDDERQQMPFSRTTSAEEAEAWSHEEQAQAVVSRKRAKGYGQGFRVFLRSYLWTIAVCFPILTWIRVGVYPCVVSVSPPFFTSPVQVSADDDFGTGNPPSAKVNFLVMPLVTADTVLKDKMENDRLEARFDSAAEKANLSQPVETRIYQLPDKQVVLVRLCVENLSLKVLLWCLFYVPLLLYLAVNILFPKRAAHNDSLSDEVPSCNFSSSSVNQNKACRLATTQRHSVDTTVANLDALPTVTRQQFTTASVDTEACAACQKMAPFVPMTTVVLLVQHVLVMPVWVAVTWIQSRQMIIVPPVFFFLPAYCAVCFVFVGILLHPA